jgi:hypothetical protein
MVPQVTDLDRRQMERVAKLKATAAEPTAKPSDPSQGGGNAEPQAKPRSGDRWATYNGFIDHIAPRLTLAERAVWQVMFRYTRGGICETSERLIAMQANIDKATAGRALRQLVRLRLVWPVSKSTSKGTPSRYGVHPQPHKRLSAAIALAEQRDGVARKRRESNGGDKRGRRKKCP